jgi:AcrR family transcriptional regulator
MTAQHKVLLTRVMTAVAETVLPRPADPSADTGTVGQQPTGPGWSRREKALGAAVSLFRRRGYANVGIDEIGVAAGITGSGVYRHFASKEDLLVAAFRRTGDRLATEAIRAASAAADASRAMNDVIGAYVQVACTDPDLLFIYMHEARNLPASARREMSALQNDLYRAWEHALGHAYPELPAAAARTIIVTILGVINAAVIAEPPDQAWVLRVGHQALHAAVAASQD